MRIRNSIYAMILTGSMALTGCSNFLDVDSPSSFDTDYVFSNPEDAKKVVLGVYALFAQDSYTSRMSCIWIQNTDVETVGVAANPDGSRRDIWSLQGGLLSGFGDIYTAWQHNYLAIDRANQCIEGIQASNMSDHSEMRMLLGEAYCLRAYRYFLLTNYWGDVPYFRDAAKVGMALDIPKTDKNYIYSGSIQDLVDCEEEMYFANQFGDGIERMNREFALGMIARLSLFRAGYGMTQSGVMKKADDYLNVATDDNLAVTYTYNGVRKTARTSAEYFQLAKDYCEKLIALRGRELNPDFLQIFKNQCQWVKPIDGEMLYEVAFGNQNGGGDVGWCVGTTVTGGSYGTTTIQLNFNPAYYYSFDQKDSRRDITLSKVDWTNETTQRIAAVTSLTSGKWNRLWLPSAQGSASSKGTGINWPLLRYSDILLMYAEAENQLNGATALAKEQLAKVRRRAFNAEDHADKVDTYLANINSKEAMFEAIVDERAWEFGGEGLRKFDLVRWNNYGKKIVETKRVINNIGQAVYGVNLDNPEVAKYANHAYKLYYQIKSGKIEFLNDYYAPESIPTKIVSADDLTKPGNEDAYAEMNWGSSLYKKVTSSDGTVTYEAADYTVRSWRGYTDESGISAVPYLIAINVQTTGASAYLNNDGYGLSTIQ